MSFIEVVVEGDHVVNGAYLSKCFHISNLSMLWDKITRIDIIRLYIDGVEYTEAEARLLTKMME